MKSLIVALALALAGASVSAQDDRASLPNRLKSAETRLTDVEADVAGLSGGAGAACLVSGCTMTAPILHAAGTVTAPAIAWTADADGTGTGLYRPGVNSIGFAINGVLAAQLDSTATFAVPVLAPAGTAAAPSLAWTADSDGSGTGFYRPGANTIGASVNGVQTMQFNASTFALLNSASFQMTSASGTTYLQSGGNEVLYVGASGAGKIKAAGAQSTTAPDIYGASANTGMTIGANGVFFISGLNSTAYLSDTTLRLTSTLQYAWSSGAAGATSPDTGLARASAGAVWVSDGSSGAGTIASATIVGASTSAVSTSWFLANSAGVKTDASRQFLWSNTTSNAFAAADTGFARPTAGIIRVTNGGSGDGTLRTGAGSVSTPGYAFTSTTNTGMFDIAGTGIAFSVGGAAKFAYNSGQLLVTTAGSIGFSSGDPSSTTMDTGLERASAAALRVTGSAGVAGQIITRVYVQTSTATTNLTSANSGQYTQNIGAIGTHTINLPNDPTVGARYVMMVMAAESMDVTPASGESIRDGASTGTTKITSNTVGDTIELVATSTGSGAVWLVVNKKGTWTLS